MGTVANILQDWASSTNEKTELFATKSGEVIRWINQAQLRFSEKSESIRSLWQPTIDATGIIALPNDFHREIKDRVKLTVNKFLRQIDFPTAQIYTTFAGTNYYSIWGGNFYVFAPTACNPAIPYIKKPAEITVANMMTADLEIEDEWNHYLFTYFDSMWARKKDNIADSIALLKEFDSGCEEVYKNTVSHFDPVPMIRGTFF